MKTEKIHPMAYVIMLLILLALGLLHRQLCQQWETRPVWRETCTGKTFRSCSGHWENQEFCVSYSKGENP